MARSRANVAALYVGALVLSVARVAGADGSLEYPVKAALLVNFARFAEWPKDSPQASAPAVSICVMGHDPFGALLEKTIAGRSAAGRPMVVERPANVEGARSCNVLFIASSEASRLPQVLEALADRPVLTVGESPGFARRGGMIGLVVEDNLARFEVNLQRAQHQDLVLSSKLLGVARLVETAAEGRP